MFMAKRIWNLSLKEVSRISHMFMVEEPVSYDIYKKVMLSNITNVNIDNEENLINKYGLYVTRYFFVKENKIGAKLTKSSHLGFYGKNSIHEQYYLDRGWNPEESKKLLNNRQGTMKLENIAISNNISLEEAKILLKAKTDNMQEKVRNNPNIENINKSKGKSRTVQFYVDKGHSLEEATLILRKIQQKAASSIDFTKDDRSHTQIGYWLKKGLTEREAVEKIKSIQNTFSLQKCILKHGKEKGTEVWEKRQARWQYNMKNKSVEEIYQINLKKFKANKNIFYSNSSFEWFSKIEKLLKNDGIECECLYGKNELLLRNEKTVSFFDFYAIGSKLIIEFNGSHVHPDKKTLSPEQWQKWKNPFTKENADDCHIKDQKKINFAKEQGYKVIEIWDHALKSDPDLTLKIKNIIKDELNSNKHKNIN